MGLRIGDVVEGKFRIVGRLGEGGMGTVYEAVHAEIHRRVAIKVLKAGHSADDQMVLRFEREAQAAGRIGSDHIAEVHDVGRLPSGERYMILEYLAGESLSDRLRRTGRMRCEEILPLLVQLLDGLEAAHRAGIVHRDLKPANVFLVDDRKGYDDFVKILDFGVSKFRDLTEGEGMTTTGTIVGTPHYMAPELTKGARLADHRSDLYSAGALAYRALAGRPPYQGDTIHELLTRLISEPPPPLESLVPDMDPSAGWLIHRALERDPDKRYPSAQAFAAEVRHWLEERGMAPDGRSSLSSLPGTSRSGSHRPTMSQSGERAGMGSGSFDPRASAAARERVTVVDRPPGRSEPPSLLTPSPSIYDSRLFRAARRPRFGIVVGLVALAVVAAVVVISRNGTTDPDHEARPAKTQAAPPGVDATASTASTGGAAKAAPVPSVSSSAAASVGASASTSASVTASTSAPATAPPRPVFRPRPKRPEREIRTDL